MGWWWWCGGALLTVVEVPIWDAAGGGRGRTFPSPVALTEEEPVRAHGAGVMRGPSRGDVTAPSCSPSSASPPSSPTSSASLSPELGNVSPVALSVHLIPTSPNRQCCTTGTLPNTSTLYMSHNPFVTLCQLGTVVAIWCRSGECS